MQHDWLVMVTAGSVFTAVLLWILLVPRKRTQFTVRNEERASPDNPINVVIQKVGSIRKLARALDVTHQAIYLWRSQGYFPLKRAIEIEKKYGIPAHTLIDPRIRNVVEGK